MLSKRILYKINILLFLLGWAQWRTTQIAIMLYYIREQNPSENLIKIVTYSTQAWAPTVFGIMIHPQFEYTSFHYMNYIIWSKEALSLEDWDGIVKKDFIVNSHPAHPETILYCAIGKSTIYFKFLPFL